MFVGKVFSFVLKQSKVAAKEALNCWKYPGDIYKGAKCAKRLSQIKDYNILQSSVTQGKSFIRQTGKHLPGLLVGAATPVPVPGSGAIAYGVGKGLQKLFLLV